VLYRFLYSIVKNMFVVEPEAFLHYIKTRRSLNTGDKMTRAYSYVSATSVHFWMFMKQRR
jgi:hypothetical protein